MFLGLDLGTTNIKALVTDSAGQPLAQAASPVPLLHAAAGGVEQDLDAIEQATLAVLQQVAGAVDPSGIDAIGVSSQGGAMQVLAPDGQPVGRVISWLDQRGRPFDRALLSELGRSWLLERLGRGVPGVSVGQSLRLHQEQPGLLTPPNRVGFVGDIIVGRLCGRGAHDMTSGSLTVLLNPWLRDYDPELLRRLRLDAGQLPELISAREAAGGLRADVARQTGLRAGTPVSAAIHDQYAAALGTGAVRAGTVMVGTGTAWVLLAVHDRLAAPVIDEAFVCHHVVDGLCGQILSLVNGGSAFTWALNLMGLGNLDGAAVEALLESTQPGSAGIRCWPFLVSAGVSGLASGTHGRLAGLQLAHRPADVLRAVVEGLAFELTRYLEFLPAAGWPVARLVMGGGAALSQVTTRILADATGLPLACLSSGEASLLGAAILARGLVEPHRSLAELSEAMVPPARPLEPGEHAAFYRDQYQEYLCALPRQDARPSS